MLLYLTEVIVDNIPLCKAIVPVIDPKVLSSHSSFTLNIG